MNAFLVFLGCVALASAQVGVPGPRWTGPQANQISGQLVQDTPEVAAAKAQHQTAYSQVSANLPILPPEIRFQAGQTVQPIQPAQPSQAPQNFAEQQNLGHQQNFAQQQNFGQQQAFSVHEHQNFGHQQNFAQQQAFAVQQPQPGFEKFAEDIPRSPLGEVPEVSAARKAHLEAVAHFNSILPPLESQTAQTQQPQLAPQFIPRAPQQPAFVPQPQAPQFVPAMVNLVNGFVQDTPEVARAKAEHARFAQLG
ncbi:unnamed protein product [Brassicogethes aeneus]|uniref:Uncharacterized protein n=1 Tax=Brassicogethes aeneus TaxID=1431903 RepID=A0A9P0BE80_BRAAE|nr:unnamed protein product [Brassicogethes aeneus]